MKTIQLNPVNVSVSILYCFFGFLSFFVFKFSLKYYQSQTLGLDQNKAIQKNISRQTSDKINFKMALLKSLFFKGTLVGSAFSKDKKYLLRELFILNSIAVSCFQINSYVIWPCWVATGLFILTTAGFEVLIPLVSKNTNSDIKFDEQMMSSKRNSVYDSTSLQIEYSQLQISVSVNRQLAQNKCEQQKQSWKENRQLVFIVFLALLTEILISQCIFKLGLSSSNSGQLNLVSLGLSVLIDQLILRIGLGIIAFMVVTALNYTQKVKFVQNKLFISFCHQEIIQKIQKIQTQNRVQAMGNKVSNLNNPFCSQQLQSKKDSHLPFIFQDHSRSEYVQDLYPSESLIPPPFAIFQQNQEGEREEHQTSKNIVRQNAQFAYELWPQDLTMFQEQWIQIVRQVENTHQTKKRLKVTQQKFKSDPLLYFPYEEHKVSHRSSVRQQINQNQEQLQPHAHKNSFVNKLSKIEVLECMDDQMETIQPEIGQIGLILNEKNLNIRTLNVKSQPPLIIKSSRQANSVQRQLKSTKSVSKIKKVSPYLVNLPSEAVKPHKIKKLNISKLNKENSTQFNKKFMLSQNIQIDEQSGKLSKIKNYDFESLDKQNINYIGK